MRHIQDSMAQKYETEGMRCESSSRELMSKKDIGGKFKLEWRGGGGGGGGG